MRSWDTGEPVSMSSAMGWRRHSEHIAPALSGGSGPHSSCSPRHSPAASLLLLPLISKPKYVCASLKKLKQIKNRTEADALTLQRASLGGFPARLLAQSILPCFRAWGTGANAPLKQHREPGPRGPPPRLPPSSPRGLWGWLPAGADPLSPSWHPRSLLRCAEQAATTGGPQTGGSAELLFFTLFCHDFMQVGSLRPSALQTDKSLRSRQPWSRTRVQTPDENAAEAMSNTQQSVSRE